jgi:tRNA threonylcarbamoyladenosine biosynthesis protein TsaB
MLILGLTSSTAAVGVALARDGELLSVRQRRTDRRHAEELTPMLTEVLAECAVSVRELDRIAVDVGPGRFTGMRVGLATARALAFAVDCPVVGVTSLELLAASMSKRPIVAIIDARRKEVFQQVFLEDGSGGAVPRVGSPADLIGDVPEGATLVGDGADRYHDLYGSAVQVGVDPSAAVLVRLAADRPAMPGHRIEPMYLREPDVQINIKTRLNS